MKPRIKVIWICHFSNPEIREKLSLSKNGRNSGDFAAWITNLISEFKSFDEVEIHVVSPHLGLKRILQTFEHEGIIYHFFKADIPFLNRYWPTYFRLDAWTGYLRNRMIVNSVIRKIQPDLINLMGAENAYYSSTILGIKKIPVLVTIQGIYSNEERFKSLKKDSVRYNIERRIHKENKYFGISASFMPELIKRDCPSPVLFWNRFPIKMIERDNIPAVEKKYDFVFFGRQTPTKGSEDVLKALVKVKKYKPDVTLRMMGPVTNAYLDHLKGNIRRRKLEKNVVLSGSFPLQTDLLKEALKANYYVLPTRIDTIPTTIFEAINLGMAVVSYRTGDIPRLNIGETRLLLCEPGDIQGLADNMIRLLKDPTLGPDLNHKTKIFMQKWFDNRFNSYHFIQMYKAILSNFYQGSLIPRSLLYENYMKDIEE